MCCYGLKKVMEIDARSPSLLSEEAESSLFMLRPLWKENFIKCRWSICHTFFILVTLFTKLAVNIRFIIKKFKQRSCQKPFEKEKQIAYFFLFQLQLLDIIYIVWEKEVQQRCFFLGFLKLIRKMFGLEVCLSRSRIFISFHATGTLSPSPKDQYYF